MAPSRSSWCVGAAARHRSTKPACGWWSSPPIPPRDPAPGGWWPTTPYPAGGTNPGRRPPGHDEAIGRASTAGGLPAAVEATVYAVRTFLPDLTYLPGWARTVETTPERRFLVVASVTDPLARTHRRGVAEGATPVEGAVRATLAALNRTISRDL